MTTNAGALKRLELVIEGVAERTVGSVTGLVDQLRTAGMSPEAIARRIEAEIAAGPVLAELRRFAIATVPGYTGDMAFRFARDTLSQVAKNQDIRKRLNEEERFAEKAAPAIPEVAEEQIDRISEIRDTYEQTGIDTTAWEEGELPEPPPDADMEELYYWVGVEDARQCDVCRANHELSQRGPQTLSYWVDVGEPRSGACAGESNCRCILVPAETISKKEINSVFREMTKVQKKKAIE